MPVLDQIVVVDIEATCWEGAPPPGQVSDIIEIGVALLDVATLEVGEKHSLLVRPGRSDVSRFCTALTTLTAEQVAAGTSLAEACHHLQRHFDTANRVWASFGDYDRRMFESCCTELGVPYPFGPTHLNVKALVPLAFGLPVQQGLRGTLARLGLDFAGTLHRGDDDAWNVARLLAVVLRAARAGASHAGGTAGSPGRRPGPRPDAGR